MKYRVTNTSHKVEGGARNVFLTPAGKMIKPGEHALCHRLDPGTMRLVEAKVLKLEEGDFSPPIEPAEGVKPPVAGPATPTSPAREADKALAAKHAREMDERMRKAEEEAKAKAEAEENERAEEIAKKKAELVARAEASSTDGENSSDLSSSSSGKKKKKRGGKD